MVSMLIGYALSVGLADYLIYRMAREYRIEMLLYWNASNFVYACLNIVLIFIINF
jgi:hypothetical protein